MVVNQLGSCARTASARLGRLTELACAVLIGVLVLDVWFGIVGRYFIDMGVTFTEELARYVMVWVALLAVSCGIAKRDHVAVTFVFERVPQPYRRWLSIGFDAIAFALFAVLFVFGLGMTASGASQYGTLWGLNMVVPYAAIPVSSALACLQLILVAIAEAHESGPGQPSELAAEID